MVARMVQNSNLMQHLDKVFVHCKIRGGWFLFADCHPFPNLLYLLYFLAQKISTPKCDLFLPATSPSHFSKHLPYQPPSVSPHMQKYPNGESQKNRSKNVPWIALLAQVVMVAWGAWPSGLA
jgi:hypothetical protein